MRLRILFPGRRNGVLLPRLSAVRRAVAGLLACIFLAACGGSGGGGTTAQGPGPPASHRRGAGLAIGLTEPNANLIWSAAARPRLPAGFGPWRDRLASLHPDYLRVVVDWATLQPTASHPPSLAGSADGCERGVGPCAAYAGLKDLFAAIASNRGLTPVVVIYGAPAWATQPIPGCEPKGTPPSADALAAAGLPAYRALISRLLELARGVGLELPWWSPWNEPNHPDFIRPQRARCAPGSPALAPAVYTRLARSMQTALAADGHPHRLVLGDLAGFVRPTPVAAGGGEFVGALPKDLVCSAGAWAVHYGLAPAARAEATVAALERALAHRACPAGPPPIWVTEAGAPTDAPASSCRDLAGLLAHWNADRHVDAVFQYTFRQDPLFRLGLVDTGLTRVYPAYAVWRAWGARAAGDPAPPPAAAEASRACRTTATGA